MFAFPSGMIGWYLVTAILAIPSLWAAARVRSTFHRYARLGVRTGMSGAEAAAAVLRAAGIAGVRIEPHRGMLTDHYDPRAKALRLSPGVYGGRSVSAVAVAAHEAGHAIQDAHAYFPLKLRSAIVPVAMIGDRLWMVLFFLGIFANATGMIYAGIALFAAVILFQLVTLPTEFDASRRAKAVLASSGIVTTEEEAEGVSKVLGAAALTYVAAAVTAIGQLIYMLSLARRD
ncbi:MAG: zinc metallopeptidase [Planctomycetes bacterium]|nr:zinc metallopeptidase [Planctomycetota bacterium]